MNEKVVVVSGATRGLGLAISRRLLESGYRVAALGRKSTPGLEELRARHPDGLSWFVLDLADAAAIHPVSREIHRQMGSVYGLVNNAAIAHDGVLATLHDSQIEATVAVNVTGTILLTKHLLRPMLLGEGGRIVNIASIVARTGFNGLSVYGATKAALIGFTKSLAREVGRAGITVNSVSPGYMKTDMSAGLEAEQLESIRRRSPMGRLAEVTDVAEIVEFLLSNRACNLTGADIVVDAGSTA